MVYLLRKYHISNLNDVTYPSMLRPMALLYSVAWFAAAADLKSSGCEAGSLSGYAKDNYPEDR